MQFLPAAALGLVGAGALTAIDVVREDAKQPRNGEVSHDVSIGLGVTSLAFGALTAATGGPRGITGGLLGIGAGALIGATIGAELAD